MDGGDIARQFITLFVVIDPIGTLPVFLFAAQSVPHNLHRRLAIRAVAVAALVLLAFLFVGQIMIEGLGLRLGSFQIAGGLILFLFAMTMIFGHTKPEREIEEAERDHMAGAVFPLAMPSIASPGAMLAIVILTDNRSNSFADQLVTVALLSAVLLLTLGVLLMASRVQKIIGATGASVISRVMGLILATVAVDSVLGGLDAVGVLTVQGEGAISAEGN